MKQLKQLQRAVAQKRWAPGSEVLTQVRQAGYQRHFTKIEVHELSLAGHVRPDTVECLRADTRFAKGGLHRLHPEVEPPRIDFRAWSGAFGKGSLQIVISKRTGRCHCDVDRFNPYQDVVNIVGHAYEVIDGWWKRLWA
jgi:hypothetical protein